MSADEKPSALTPWSAQVVVCVSLLAAAFLHVPSAGAATSVDSMRETYEKHIAKIEMEQGQASSRCRKVYVRSLNDLLKSMQSAGNLDGYTAVKSEIDRFEQKRIVKHGDIVEKPEALKKLQNGYLEAKDNAVRDKCEKILALTKKYTQALDRLQVRSTKDGKVEDALAYREEAARAKASPKVQSAEFELAELSASQPQPEPPPVSVTPTPTPVKPEKVATVDIPQDGKEISGCRVYPGPGPSMAGLRFKRLVMKSTPDARVARGASVNVQEGDLSKVTTKGSSSSYYSYYYGSRSSVEKSLVRVGVRAPGGMQNVQVVIQLFSKGVASAGSLDANLMGTYRLPVGDLDSKGVTVDCPPVQTAKSRRSSYYYGSSSSKRGTEFFGASVTVFGGDGKLAYQAASSPALYPFAADIKFTPTVAEKASARAQDIDAARKKYEQLRDVYYSDTSNRAARELYYKARDEYYNLRGRSSSSSSIRVREDG